MRYWLKLASCISRLITWWQKDDALTNEIPGYCLPFWNFSSCTMQVPKNMQSITSRLLYLKLKISQVTSALCQSLNTCLPSSLAWCLLRAEVTEQCSLEIDLVCRNWVGFLVGVSIFGYMYVCVMSSVLILLGRVKDRSNTTPSGGGNLNIPWKDLSHLKWSDSEQAIHAHFYSPFLPTPIMIYNKVFKDILCEVCSLKNVINGFLK